MEATGDFQALLDSYTDGTPLSVQKWGHVNSVSVSGDIHVLLIIMRITYKPCAYSVKSIGVLASPSCRRLLLMFPIW